MALQTGAAGGLPRKLVYDDVVHDVLGRSVAGLAWTDRRRLASRDYEGVLRSYRDRQRKGWEDLRAYWRSPRAWLHYACLPYIALLFLWPSADVPPVFVNLLLGSVVCLVVGAVALLYGFRRERVVSARLEELVRRASVGATTSWHEATACRLDGRRGAGPGPRGL